MAGIRKNNIRLEIVMVRTTLSHRKQTYYATQNVESVICYIIALQDLCYFIEPDMYPIYLIHLPKSNFLSSNKSTWKFRVSCNKCVSFTH